MSRIAAIEPEVSTGKKKQIFDGVKGKLGMVPNMLKVMANSEAGPAELCGVQRRAGRGFAGCKGAGGDCLVDRAIERMRLLPFGAYGVG